MSTNEYLALSYEEKIKMMENDPKALDLPEEAAYLAQYLAQYRPVNEPTHGPENQSSADIVETMQSVFDYDIALISRIMRMLGYRLHVCGDLCPTWSMVHIEDLI